MPLKRLHPIGGPLRGPLLGVLIMVATAGTLFYFFQHRLSSAVVGVGLHPEVLEALDASMEDQKELRRLNAASESTYRSRFEAIQRLSGRLRILAHSRPGLARRFQWLLLALFGLTVVTVTGVSALLQGRKESRLARLGHALEELALGGNEVRLGDSGRDTIGRIATMIEQTSQRMARDRRRLSALQNLSTWQEAARRHAHEMRTPLTGARLEIQKIQDVAGEPSQQLETATESALAELDRLAEFTRRFTSFARLPRPKPERVDLPSYLESFVETFGSAWPRLRLAFDAAEVPAVAVDRDMLRQVLVNLCDNVAHALGERAEPGEVRFSVGLGGDALPGVAWIDVRDNGPGIDPAVRETLFQPYATTRSIGEGVGLGLAISKKILLDHDGDLELLDSSARGACFRLTLPLAGEGRPEEVQP